MFLFFCVIMVVFDCFDFSFFFFFLFNDFISLECFYFFVSLMNTNSSSFNDNNITFLKLNFYFFHSNENKNEISKTKIPTLIFFQLNNLLEEIQKLNKQNILNNDIVLSKIKTDIKEFIKLNFKEEIIKIKIKYEHIISKMENFEFRELNNLIENILNDKKINSSENKIEKLFDFKTEKNQNKDVLLNENLNKMSFFEKTYLKEMFGNFREYENINLELRKTNIKTFLFYILLIKEL